MYIFKMCRGLDNLLVYLLYIPACDGTRTPSTACAIHGCRGLSPRRVCDGGALRWHMAIRFKRHTVGARLQAMNEICQLGLQLF